MTPLSSVHNTAQSNQTRFQTANMASRQDYGLNYSPRSVKTRGERIVATCKKRKAGTSMALDDEGEEVGADEEVDDGGDIDNDYAGSSAGQQETLLKAYFTESEARWREIEPTRRRGIRWTSADFKRLAAVIASRLRRSGLDRKIAGKKSLETAFFGFRALDQVLLYQESELVPCDQAGPEREERAWLRVREIFEQNEIDASRYLVEQQRDGTQVKLRALREEVVKGIVPEQVLHAVLQCIVVEWNVDDDFGGESPKIRLSSFEYESQELALRYLLTLTRYIARFPGDPAQDAEDIDELQPGGDHPTPPELVAAQQVEQSFYRFRDSLQVDQERIILDTFFRSAGERGPEHYLNLAVKLGLLSEQATQAQQATKPADIVKRADNTARQRELAVIKRFRAFLQGDGHGAELIDAFTNDKVYRPTRDHEEARIDLRKLEVEIATLEQSRIHGAARFLASPNEQMQDLLADLFKGKESFLSRVEVRKGGGAEITVELVFPMSDKSIGTRPEGFKPPREIVHGILYFVSKVFATPGNSWTLPNEVGGDEKDELVRRWFQFLDTEWELRDKREERIARSLHNQRLQSDELLQRVRRVLERDEKRRFAAARYLVAISEPTLNILWRDAAEYKEKELSGAVPDVLVKSVKRALRELDSEAFRPDPAQSSECNALLQGLLTAHATRQGISRRVIEAGTLVEHMENILRGEKSDQEGGAKKKSIHGLDYVSKEIRETRAAQRVQAKAFMSQVSAWLASAGRREEDVRSLGFPERWKTVYGVRLGEEASSAAGNYSVAGGHGSQSAGESDGAIEGKARAKNQVESAANELIERLGAGTWDMSESHRDLPFYGQLRLLRKLCVGIGDLYERRDELRKRFEVEIRKFADLEISE